MYKSYAGIGSRETPSDILILFERIGEFLAKQGWTLRSGGADGADTAFENGCDYLLGSKEIYLPWSGFNNNNSDLVVKDYRAYEIAKKYHPRFDGLSDGAKKLQARNSHQILGLDLNSPCDMVLCYTKKSGGTTQALRIAKDFNIPIFNVYDFETTKDWNLNLFKHLSTIPED